ncbi:serine hydroxymethyltransferase [Caldimonas brevitalea]|uniref:Serine hydroxymethyltransferase n=1 Tax=Caldimonas brevitalea TaxID=413882 RepID=A0A0G3BKI7_9BURK|nr:serine hydroxymethyltransferase [Caldimonas brevitalea]AKJ27060.1 serine hydroxymethyltransferase [Caldimonas brevitalea]
MYYNHLSAADPTIAKLMKGEEHRQITGLELIASENYVSPAIMEAMGSVLNNRYSEGYPGRRYYGGQEFTDQIEQIAIDRAKALFRCEHANVQPHAGAPANIATYLALAEPGSTILGMELAHGGHLTHGHPVTHVAKIYNFVRYRMSDVETGRIDYDEMREVARREKPKILLAGFSAYPRELDYKVMREIATEVGAWAVADVAHIAGLIVGKQLANPFDAGFDVVLTTTHKSLRGPRGGMILSREASTGKLIDKSVFPSFQGGPIMQMVAAKAVAFQEAARPEFVDYAAQIIANAKTLAATLMERGARLITNGTDNHLMLVDSVSSWALSGGVAEKRLDEVGITLNKNMIPDEPRSAMDPSGVRMGTPALTTRGMKEAEMAQVADLIHRTLSAKDDNVLPGIREEVIGLAKRFPVPGISLPAGDSLA